MSTSAAEAGNKARLFLALWPHGEIRTAVGQYRDAWRWPPKVARMRDEKLHLTLHFIGDVERERLPEIRQQLHLPFEPCELQFGFPELWPHGIAVLRPHAVPDALLRLHAALSDALRGLALPVDAREFRPHVTLARKAGEALPPKIDPAINWNVDGYALVESRFDPHRTYTVLDTYSHSGVVA